MALLSKTISDATGYSEDEAKEILLRNMNREVVACKTTIPRNAVNLDSWAAITLCYETNDSAILIKRVGKKKS